MKPLAPLLLLLLAACAAAPAAASDDGMPEGIRAYTFGLIRRGPAWTAEDSPERRALQAAHLENIARLTAEGKLVLAGPFAPYEDDDPLLGIFLYETTDLAEARALADADPAVAAGRLVVELIPWWGPAGIRHVGSP